MERRNNSNVEKGFISRFVNKNDLSYPTHSVHIFAENNPVGEHNRERLNELNSPLYTTNTISKISPEVNLSQSQIEAINARKISDTDNLRCKLEIKNGAQVMLTTNVNLENRLVNGLVGWVMEFKSTGSTVKVIYVKFNDKKACKMAMERDV